MSQVFRLCGAAGDNPHVILSQQLGTVLYDKSASVLLQCTFDINICSDKLNLSFSHSSVPVKFSIVLCF